MVRRALLLIFGLVGLARADTGYASTIRVTETDNSPACTIGQLKVSAGSLTCAGQTATVVTGGGGGGGSSALGVTTGTTAGWTTMISSPTGAIVADQSQFSVGLQGGTTAFLTIAYSSTNVTGNYTTTSTDSFITANCGSACTITLSTTSIRSGKVLMAVQAGAANVTLSPAAGTISGGSTALMNQQYSELDVIWDGQNFFVK